MLSQTVNILLVEDNQGDYSILQNLLSESGINYTLIWKTNLKDGINLLNQNIFDIVLLDLGLPDSTGIATLQTVIQTKTNTAVVVFTGVLDELLGVEMVKQGAQDYIIKGEVGATGLARVIRYAIERKETEKVLKNHKVILEQEVHRRTWELRDANSKLIKEIEARKETEKSLAESEEYFRSISEAAKDAIIKMDSNGMISFWNHAAEEIFGYTSNEAIGKDPHILLAHADYLDRAKRAAEAFGISGSGNAIGKTIEMLALKKDQTVIPIEISLSSTKIGDKWNAVGIIRDITERKETESKLRENLIFLDILIETMPTPVFYKDKHGICLGCNVAFLDFNGLTREQVVGKSVFDISTSELAEVYHKKDMELIRTGGVQVYELQTRKPDGEIRDVIYHKAAFLGSDNQVAGLVGIILDFTETRQNQRELQQLKDDLEKIVDQRTSELKEANATKDVFFSIIAHDLKSPFNSISGFLNLMYEDYDSFSDDEKKRFLKTILDTANNTFSLLENLLEWSRSQRGKIIYSPETIDISMLIEEIIFILQRNAENKQIKILPIADDNLTSWADVNMARTILRNLVSNAIKFSYPNQRVMIKSQNSGDEVIISVSDKGTGIKESDLSKLFKIDEKIQKPGTLKEKGTGLGLVLCKEFASKNRGKIWVESELGKGSTFSFSLPARKPEE